MTIEIDQGSGFCFGVTRAIGKAEEELAGGSELYCLGDIVHNGMECERLQQLGLRTINREEYNRLHHAKVLLRAHGEPPSTYEQAKANDIEIIDATCPVVLHLQERIKREYDNAKADADMSDHADASTDRNLAVPQGIKLQKQIVIFGKNGHAEVLGLVGQTEGTAIVIETPEEVERLDFTRDICLYSQTTKSLDGFRRVVEYIQQHISPEATFTYYDTICRNVSNRLQNIRSFAARHDVVLFVCGRKSSNGRVLYNECLKQNQRCHMIEAASEVDLSWLNNCASVGICGATSTPKWLMEECKVRIEQLLGSGE